MSAPASCHETCKLCPVRQRAGRNPIATRQVSHEPTPEPQHRRAADRAAAAVGRQRRGGPARQRAGAADHAELPALGAGLRCCCCRWPAGCCAAAVACGRTGGASRCWACWAWAATTRCSTWRCKTSTPLNVTLVAASSPVWMLGIGALFFGAARLARATRWAPLLSIAGVLVVLSRGEWQLLVAGAAGAGRPVRAAGHGRWAFYSWLLIRAAATRRDIRGDWAAFLMAQIVFGLGWSGAVRRRRMGDGRRPHRVGLAAGGRAGLRGRRPGHPGLPLLGHGRAARRARTSRASSPTSRRCSRP